jgi:hypothetical protein
VRRLAELVSERLQSSGLSGRPVTAKLRYGDFSIRTRSTLAAAIDEAEVSTVACSPLGRGLRTPKKAFGPSESASRDLALPPAHPRGVGGPVTAQSRRSGRVRHVGPPSPSEISSPR